MKKNICKLIKDKKGVSHPLEVVFAFSVILISFSLIFVAVSNLFTPYSGDEFVLRSKAMAISERLIKDPGLSKDGTCDWEIYPRINIRCLGLASLIVINDTWILPAPRIAEDVEKTSTFYPNDTSLVDINDLTITNYSYKLISSADPMRIKYVVSDRVYYGALDYDKIYALNSVPYDDNDDALYNGKEAIGLEDNYDFNIEITGISGKELLKYGRPYEGRDVVGEFSRNVLVYYSYSTSYIAAKLTVYVF